MYEQVPLNTVALLTAALVVWTGSPSVALAQDCHDQIPDVIGSDVSASSSGHFTQDYEAWKAFDFAIDSMWISEIWETPAWIAYDFGVRKVVNLYRITFTNGLTRASRAPKDFKLQGWSGSGWVTVDTRTDQTGWHHGAMRVEGGLVRSYNVASPGSFSKYRLHITDDNDPRPGIVVISIGDLELIHSTLATSISCKVSSRTIQCGAETTGGTPPYSYQWSYSGTASMWSGSENFAWASWPPTVRCVDESTFNMSVIDACGVLTVHSQMELCEDK